MEGKIERKENDNDVEAGIGVGIIVENNVVEVEDGDRDMISIHTASTTSPAVSTPELGLLSEQENLEIYEDGEGEREELRPLTTTLSYPDAVYLPRRTSTTHHHNLVGNLEEERNIPSPSTFDEENPKTPSSPTAKHRTIKFLGSDYRKSTIIIASACIIFTLIVLGGMFALWAGFGGGGHRSDGGGRRSDSNLGSSGGREYDSSGNSGAGTGTGTRADGTKICSGAAGECFPVNTIEEGGRQKGVGVWKI